MHTEITRSSELNGSTGTASTRNHIRTPSLPPRCDISPEDISSKRPARASSLPPTLKASLGVANASTHVVIAGYPQAFEASDGDVGSSSRAKALSVPHQSSACTSIFVTSSLRASSLPLVLDVCPAGNDINNQTHFSTTPSELDYFSDTYSGMQTSVQAPEKPPIDADDPQLSPNEPTTKTNLQASGPQQTPPEATERHQIHQQYQTKLAEIALLRKKLLEHTLKDTPQRPRPNLMKAQNATSPTVLPPPNLSPTQTCTSSTAAQTLPPLNHAAFTKCYGRAPQDPSLEPNYASPARFTRSPPPHTLFYGAATLKPKLPQPKNYISSSFQTMDFADSDAPLQQARQDAAQLVHKFRAVAQTQGFYIGFEPDVERIVHSEQFPVRLELDARGAAEYRGDAVVFPNVVGREIVSPERGTRAVVRALPVQVAALRCSVGGDKRSFTEFPAVGEDVARFEVPRREVEVAVESRRKRRAGDVWDGEATLMVKMPSGPLYTAENPRFGAKKRRL